MPPNEWIEFVARYTSRTAAGKYGPKAARYVDRKRRRSGVGPTFRELLDALAIPVFELTAPEGMKVRRESQNRVAFAIIARWRARHWLYFTDEPRSLEPGPAYRGLIAREQRAKDLARDPQSPNMPERSSRRAVDSPRDRVSSDETIR